MASVAYGTGVLAYRTDAAATGIDSLACAASKVKGESYSSHTSVAVCPASISVTEFIISSCMRLIALMSALKSERHSEINLTVFSSTWLYKRESEMDCAILTS